jgi:hypothetical protein
LIENKVLRRIFGSMREEVTGVGGDCIIKSFMILYFVHNAQTGSEVQAASYPMGTE